MVVEIADMLAPLVHQPGARKGQDNLRVRVEQGNALFHDSRIPVVIG